MEGKDPAQRAQMAADFKQMYGQEGGADLAATLKENLSGLDLQKAEQLKETGKLDDAFALKYATQSSFFSTDTDLIKKTLSGKSKADIDKLLAANPGLRESLPDSGRDGFEVGLLLKGEPKTLDEKLARAKEAYAHERDGGFGAGFTDLMSGKGGMLDAQQQRLDALAKRVKGGDPSAAAELNRVLSYQSMDVKSYQEDKDKVANTAAAAAAITASAIATVATAGAASPAMAAAIAAAAGGGATIVTKFAIEGSDYSKQDFERDAAMTGVSMLTGGAMGALGAEGGALFNAASKLTDNPLAQQALIQGVSGAVNSGVGGAAKSMLHGGNAKATRRAAWARCRVAWAAP